MKGLIFILTQKQLESIIFENTILSIEGISLVGLILLIFVYWKRAEKSPFSKGYIFYTFLMICYVSSHMLKHVNEVFGINEIFFIYKDYIFCPSSIYLDNFMLDFFNQSKAI